jgi:DNA modification methylase
LIAAVRNRRRCYAVEFEPKFVQVAVQRYVDYFGEPTVKINGSLVDWEQMVE